MFPCPFCGTSPDDDEHRPTTLESGDTWQMECGKCGACWPKIKREDIAAMDIESELFARLNLRAKQPERATE
jgi:hypothetical protein